MPQPEILGYYPRIHHRAAIYAMQTLIAANPDHNSTAIALRAVEYADALVKELKLRETSGDYIDPTL